MIIYLWTRVTVKAKEDAIEFDDVTEDITEDEYDELSMLFNNKSLEDTLPDSLVFRIFHHHLSARGSALRCLLDPASLSLKLRTNLRFIKAATASDIHERDDAVAINATKYYFKHVSIVVDNSQTNVNQKTSQYSRCQSGVGKLKKKKNLSTISFRFLIENRVTLTFVQNNRLRSFCHGFDGINEWTRSTSLSGRNALCQGQDFQLESCEWGACVHSKPAPTPRIHVPRLFPNGIRFYSPTRYSSREGFSSAFTPEELNDDRNEAAVSIRR
ncbi:hypothetical protein CDAR_24071 [Caerostris darwini]|uniref:Uncharacterized protein n=1 Tax=Caerostris darwini TaxID=1538125 RepID=A0AAV4QK36_9ARAC|nr:hypothetical protein CDAR_24071 [Caerostris darwini]